MKLSKVERAMLVNQLEIRKALTKSDDFDDAIEILESGYEIFYEQAVGRLYDPMSAEKSRFVFDVLDMYRAIELFHDKNPNDEEVAKLSACHFRGFDGNNETEYMAFTRFLIKDQKKYAEQLKYEKDTDEYNSHCQMLETYAELVERWKVIKERWELTREQVISILDRKPKG